TAYNMSEWREFVGIVKASPHTDYLVLIVTFLLTVIFDLVIAIVAGLIFALVLFMKKMSEETDIRGWVTVNDENDRDAIRLKAVPKDTMVYEITGPIFFGAADRIARVISQSHTKVVILRMRSVPVIDATGIHSFEALIKTCQKKGITLIMSHVNHKPMKFFHKSGIYHKVGKENFCENIDAALARPREITESK
ncbi:MAG: STAS domain-containing protein, partial [Clostridia bacterium]|nr:STAS domain-containing protein [Clostridia bacterium]